ncbi:MAG: hypothetical protein KAJ57_10605, partial [Woeseiaceae bacterium]|nr:hypothetical protein [Woeseiaceae bacterium]
IPAPLRRYVLAQFCVAVAAMLTIGALFAISGVKAVMVPCLLLWALLYTLGLLNEGRPYATRFELLRLLIIVPAGVAGLSFGTTAVVLGPWLWPAAGGYLLVSIFGMYRAVREVNKKELKQSVTTY